MQCDDRDESARGAAVGGAGCESKAFLVLKCWDGDRLQGEPWGCWGAEGVHRRLFLA
jgi:hypothetical protein